MILSASTAAKIRRLSHLNQGIAKTYLYAKLNGYPLDFFPEEYRVLDEIPNSSICEEKISPEWMKSWLALWPKPSVTGRFLDYSIAGNAPECKKRMIVFVKEFNDRLNCTDCSLETKLDIIFRATSEYLADRESHRWEYSKKNVKFIKDNNGSTLEAWCQKVMEDQPKKRSRSI